jgi:fatty acid-binding protein DegV
LVLYAKDLVDSGLSAEEIYKKCLQRIPNVQASFALKRLDYLYKGGRCSGLAYFGANLLKIRPQTYVWGHILIIVCALYGLIMYKPKFVCKERES